MLPSEMMAHARRRARRFARDDEVVTKSKNVAPTSARRTPSRRRPSTPQRRKDTKEAQRHQRDAETPETRRDTRDTQRQLSDLRGAETPERRQGRRPRAPTDRNHAYARAGRRAPRTTPTPPIARAPWPQGPARPEGAQRHQRDAETPETRRDTRDTQRHQRGAETPGRRRRCQTKIMRDLMGNTRSGQLRRHLRAWLYLHFCCI